MLRSVFRSVDQAMKNLEEWSIFLTVAVALIVALANILLRKFTDINLYWSDEVVRKVIYFTTYLGAVTAVRHRSHIRIDVLYQLLPGLTRPLNVLAHLSILAFGSFMVWLGTTMAVFNFNQGASNVSTSLKIPEWIFYAVLPVTGAMMIFRTLLMIREELSSTKEA